MLVKANNCLTNISIHNTRIDANPNMTTTTYSPPSPSLSRQVFASLVLKEGKQAWHAIRIDPSTPSSSSSSRIENVIHTFSST